jgi:hypothetical protein
VTVSALTAEHIIALCAEADIGTPDVTVVNFLIQFVKNTAGGVDRRITKEAIIEAVQLFEAAHFAYEDGLDPGEFEYNTGRTKNLISAVQVPYNLVASATAYCAHVPPPGTGDPGVERKARMAVMSSLYAGYAYLATQPKVLTMAAAWLGLCPAEEIQEIVGRINGTRHLTNVCGSNHQKTASQASLLLKKGAKVLHLGCKDCLQYTLDEGIPGLTEVKKEILFPLLIQVLDDIGDFDIQVLQFYHSRTEAHFENYHRYEIIVKNHNHGQSMDDLARKGYMADFKFKGEPLREMDPAVAAKLKELQEAKVTPPLLSCLTLSLLFSSHTHTHIGSSAQAAEGGPPEEEGAGGDQGAGG